MPTETPFACKEHGGEKEPGLCIACKEAEKVQLREALRLVNKDLVFLGAHRLKRTA